MKPDKATDASELRRRAEEQLQKRNASDNEPLSARDVQRLLHELQVHQIELEMQNEELRHSKAELEASQERLADLYDFAPVGYCTVSEEGMLLEANLTAATLLGVPRGELIGRPISRFILAEDRDTYSVCNKRLAERKKTQTCEVRLVHRRGNSFWAHLESAIATDDSGNTVSRLILSDISERKEIEEALKEAYRQNREILESSSDAFIGLTDNMVVDYVNSAAERMFNLEGSEVTGKRLFDVFPEGRGTIFEEKYSLAIRTKAEMSFQTEFTVAPYRNWYEVRVYPRPDGITVCIQVITERMRAKEKKEKLEAADRQLQKTASLGRMAGAIAHHFNNKLFVVMGFLDLTIDRMPDGDETKGALSIAREEAAKAAEVSKLMLTYLGQVASRRQLLDLSDICRKIMPLYEATLPKNVEIRTDLQAPGPVIEADEDQLRQILTNIITNAWEAAGSGAGLIRLSVYGVDPADIPASNRFPVDWQAEESRYACLEIGDTGCGITQKDIEEVFSPFFTTKFTGRGIGLSVVLGLVKANRGVITVKSVPGEGTDFRVFFPVAAEGIARKHDSAGKKSGSQQKSAKVLLVDDDTVVLDITCVMLSELGFTAVTAMDGVEALEAYRKHADEISLVISDVAMPRMDGWETLHALKKISPDLPVIFASGYSMDQVMAGDHHERPQAFLQKPYNIKILKDTIERILSATEE